MPYGELLADTLPRFKGQAAPVIVLCEIDFECAPSSRDLKKLLVGFTRAQYRLECVRLHVPWLQSALCFDRLINWISLSRFEYLPLTSGNKEIGNTQFNSLSFRQVD
jgi:hypothetical protein